jgi:hypothetical protein
LIAIAVIAWRKPLQSALGVLLGVVVGAVLGVSVGVLVFGFGDAAVATTRIAAGLGGLLLLVGFSRKRSWVA